MFNKIIFPFFNKERHEFLTKKGWFRMIIVLYSICLLLAIPFTRIKVVYNNFDSCIEKTVDIYNYEKNSAGYYPSEYYEGQIACNNKVMNTPYASRSFETFIRIFLIVLIIHYLIQLGFFKIIIDYIVLGGKNK